MPPRVPVYAESTVWAWPEWPVFLAAPGPLEICLSDRVIEDLDLLEDKTGRNLASGGTWKKINPSQESRKLARLLAGKAGLEPAAAAHLALAAAGGLTALVTLDNNLLSLKTLSALKKTAPELDLELPLIATPQSLSWPDPQRFERWAGRLIRELEEEIRPLSDGNLSRLAYERAVSSLAPADPRRGFHDDLAPLGELPEEPGEDPVQRLIRLRTNLNRQK
ncbi:MAG: hypothetical protein LBK52_03440 [Deltaproteobacteria bacterium]|jgi:hypothetical protein|nr:hypothetical protein [Deltaproteobacteria bacterium]